MSIATESRKRLHRHHPRYKWVALSNTTLGMTMATINSSIVLISLPAIFRGIGLDPLDPANVSYLLWMLLGFMLVTAALVVTFGRLGDLQGRVRIYNLGFLVFALSSIALYRALLQRIYPGKTVRAALVFTESPILLEIPAQMLDAELATLIGPEGRRA